MRPNLTYLLENESYRVCRLLTTDEFIRYCKERDILVTEWTLEKLEELQIFYPIARSTKWPYKLKIRTVNNGKTFERLGRLEENEKWDGEVKEDYETYYFGRPDTANWLEEGHFWDVKSKPFQAWNSYQDDRGNNLMKSYYSPFQAFELCRHVDSFRLNISAIDWLNMSSETRTTFDKHCELLVNHAQKYFLRDEIPLLCQSISNRYYPLTQTNQRYFALSVQHDWDWYSHVREWNPHALISTLGYTIEEIRKCWELVEFDATCTDPMEHWYELTSHVSVEKRKKLKGKALRAQLWYAMEHMLRLLYFDLSGEILPTPAGPPNTHFPDGSKVTNRENVLVQLEELTNEYNLNPRPQVLFVVEGESESIVLPELMTRMTGQSPSSLGIEVVPLKGIGQFEGKKGYDPQGALIRFIDDYHRRGTIVFILIDGEGRARRMAERLTKAVSMYEKRKVTRPEYVVVWKASIEFDNFSDDQLSRAANAQSIGKCKVMPDEINRVRITFDKKGERNLNRLFRESTGRDLNKTEFLRFLVGELHVDAPLLSVLKKVIELSWKNRPGMSRWEICSNKNEGLFGEVLETSGDCNIDG